MLVLIEDLSLPNMETYYWTNAFTYNQDNDIMSGALSK